MISSSSNILKYSLHKFGARIFSPQIWGKNIIRIQTLNIGKHVAIHYRLQLKQITKCDDTSPPKSSLLPFKSFKRLFNWTVNILFPTMDTSSNNINFGASSSHLIVFNRPESNGLYCIFLGADLPVYQKHCESCYLLLSTHISLLEQATVFEYGGSPLQLVNYSASKQPDILTLSGETSLHHHPC